MVHYYRDEFGTFQNEVFTVVNENTNISLGCYPNFKKAYERIENIANGCTIIDCGDDACYSSCVFEVVDVKEIGITPIRRYRVNRDLLVIYQNDELVPLSLTMKIKADNKKVSKYRSNV